jgi:hypothetical protein
MGCIVGQAQNGSITIGKITTPVTQPVTAQWGVWDPPNATAGGDWSAGGQFIGGIVAPPAGGIPAMLVTKPDLIPQSLTTTLGCPSSDATVENICQQAAANPADNQVFALAKEAGQVTNFTIFTWTQRVKFQLINPLLGDNCYIGSDNNPVDLNPSLSLGPGGTFIVSFDPNTTLHPNLAVLELQGAVATDSTFSAPGVTGCGPGGTANIAVDSALDTGAGLPAASGTNSLTLNGNFFFADDFETQGDLAADELAAFKASTQAAEQGNQAQAQHRFKHMLTMSQLASMGIKAG